MAITIQLTATGDIEIVADNDIIFDGKTVDFYKDATHRIKFTGHTQGATGAASGWIEASCNSANKKIFLAGSDNKIPLYWNVSNCPVWGNGVWYAIGSLVQGDDVTTNKNMYRCKVAHSGTADLRPISGGFWGSYWDLRNDLDDGRKYLYINNWS